ncbi:non-homologous end joining protein Ku [Allorhizobium taibaishanense]|uniref:Non-homologous end joining protein Ku n=1 Tax=Allorhizobium taibaishanense TaxID=887144 RepID=A0A1Q9A6N9_9HYPH|nr:Ku protein [Allorhizobium taibaishanense]MBB4008602.1 DNA end-binding protein Ku [Allorhizobium taibaishanense]OLP50256.1 Ku protein [Allorhizobium taibaishanense]
MARRAIWKGNLSFSGLNCAVALYSAMNSSEKVSFHIINRRTGNRVERQFVDTETGAPVAHDEQIKGYRLDDGTYLSVGPEEIAKLMPESDKALHVNGFLALDDIDPLYFDRAYHIAPADPEGVDALTLFSRGLEERNVAALAQAVLFRRNRIVLIRSQRGILTAVTLHFDYEVRSQKTAFKSIPEMEFDEEMLDLAGHIIDMRAGAFDPSDYTDRYDAALEELIKAKIEGRPIEKRPEPKPDNIIDLKEALRQSAKQSASGGQSKTPKQKQGAAKQKASKSSQRKAG